MCPFLIFCVPLCRSECPSQLYVSLQCSRKEMLFLLDCGLCGVGVREQRCGTPLGETLGVPSRKMVLTSRSASGLGSL